MPAIKIMFAGMARSYKYCHFYLRGKQVFFAARIVAQKFYQGVGPMSFRQRCNPISMPTALSNST